VGRSEDPASDRPEVGDAGASAVGDGQLLARVAHGDVAAFETVYDRHAGVVFGMARQVLRDPDLAEEVAQEVLVEVWRSAARFDASRGSARAWIATIARRRVVERVRTVRAAGERDLRAAAAGASRSVDEVSETVEIRMEHLQVRRCLESLTRLQRESVDLAFYRGYTQRQVSDLLEVPLGTVKSRLRDGLTRLRDCLGVA
jgi:RNA polymerase sigma-70 factor, ECF subfamily